MSASSDAVTMSYAQAGADALACAMREDANVVALGEDLGRGGIFGQYAGLQAEFGAQRVIDTPISESTIVGAAVGMALTGLKPVVELRFIDFALCAMDEIVNQAAKIRYMSGGKMTVPLVLRCPVGTANRGAQHGQSPESYFIHVPGLKVVCPSDAYHAKGIMKSAIRDDDPVLVFEHKLLYGSKGRESAGGMDLTAHVPTEEYLVPIGKAVIKRPGTSVTVVATHLTLYRCLAAAEQLAEEGIDCEVIDPLSLLPLDVETIYQSVDKTGRLVIAHEDTFTGGWGAEVAARVAGERFASLRAPILRIAAHDVPLPVAPVLEQAVVPTQERIAAEIRQLVKG
ncbi:MAG: alpha-ketoacid dehydrogenase subunit beta [Actinomycetales bacterium]